MAGKNYRRAQRLGRGHCSLRIVCGVDDRDADRPYIVWRVCEGRYRRAAGAEIVVLF
jgi:hypothetical protein